MNKKGILNLITIILFSIILLIVGETVLIVEETKEESVIEKEEDREYKKVYSQNLQINYIGYYIEPLVTIAKEQEGFNIALNNFEEGKSVYLINPLTGEKTESINLGNGNFKLEITLERNINYGVLIENSLVGAIRVVNNPEKINGEELFNEVLSTLSCGF